MQRSCRLVSRLASSLVVGLVLASPVTSQAVEVPPPAVPEAQSPIAVPEVEDVFLQTLPYDIETADYYALVAWARSIGLSDSGSAADLRSRLYQHYGVTAPAPKPAGRRSIMIQSADATEFIQATEESPALIRLSGRVAVLFSDDETKESHSIQADELLYNQDESQLIARGDVVYERKHANGSDIFMGAMLSIDLDELDGFFVDGKNTKGDSGKTQFAFEAEEILKKTDSILLFKDGRITSSKSADPYYSIRASRIWILGGKEWAVANATLYVGELPVLYLPFFYYPAQEIFFHPVFGYRDRVGRFVQTTSYLLGEKPERKETISLFNLTEGDNGFMRKVEGVFLQNTEERKGAAKSDFFKVFADYYSQLGGMTGFQTQLGSMGILNSLKAKLHVAFSRSVYEVSTTNPDGTRKLQYTPYLGINEYASVWDQSNVLGFKAPVRYLAELSLLLKLGPFSLNLTGNFLSDPFFQSDFFERSEDMDWLSFLRQPEDDKPPGKLGSLSQRVDLAGNLPVGPLNPWLESLNLSRLSSSLAWISKALPVPSELAEKTRLAAQSSREFYLPQSYVLLDSGLTLSGKLFQYPWPVKPAVPQAKPPTGAQSTTAVDDYQTDYPDLLSPWAEQDAGSGEPQQLDVGSSIPDFTAPAAEKQPASPVRRSLDASLSWRFVPAYKWYGAFSTSPWKTPEDVDWTVQYDLRTFTASGNLGLELASFGQLLKTSVSLQGNTGFQERPVILADPEQVTPTLLATWKRQDAEARKDSLSGSATLSSNPLQDFWLFSPSSLRWNLGANLYDYRFDGFDPSDQPLYTTNTLTWNKDTIKTHSLRAELAIKPYDYVQSLSLEANLPPQTSSWLLKAQSQWPFGSLSGQTRYYEKTEDEFLWAPLEVGMKLGGKPFPDLSASLTYDFDADRFSGLSSTLVWGGFNARFAMTYGANYLLTASGWQTGEAAFRPSSLGLSYSQVLNAPALWSGRLKPGLTVTLDAKQDLLRFIESSMNLSLAIRLQLHEFLDISFSSTSQNAALWRYYSGLFTLPEELSGLAPVNPVSDILNGFYFWDNEIRRTSLFKLRRLSFKTTHYMKDWNLSFELSAQPYRNQETLTYEFRNSFTILLVWNAVPEIKSEVKYADKKYVW